jgi:hypothetical protein
MNPKNAHRSSAIVLYNFSSSSSSSFLFLFGSSFSSALTAAVLLLHAPI